MPNALNEHDIVAILADMPEAGLLAGSIGTVVFVHNHGEAFEVEFPAARGSAAGGDSGVVTIDFGRLLKLRDLDAIGAA